MELIRIQHKPKTEQRLICEMAGRLYRDKHKNPQRNSTKASSHYLGTRVARKVRRFKTAAFSALGTTC
jgi:hypothetical protein